MMAALFYIDMNKMAPAINEYCEKTHVSRGSVGTLIGLSSASFTDIMHPENDDGIRPVREKTYKSLMTLCNIMGRDIKDFEVDKPNTKPTAIVKQPITAPVPPNPSTISTDKIERQLAQIIKTQESMCDVLTRMVEYLSKYDSNLTAISVSAKSIKDRSIDLIDEHSKDRQSIENTGKAITTKITQIDNFLRYNIRNIVPGSNK